MPEFVWNAGFAPSQKQKNITALHQAFNQRFPNKRLLEISSKSLQELGIRMSAFNLRMTVPSLKKAVSVECVFQGSKVFEGGGPYIELYERMPRDAKRDPRLRASGALIGFQYEGRLYPLHPATVFYDWLYVNAILDNPGYAEQLCQYDGFTDIEFNPARSINCQAKAAALFLALHRLGLLDRCRDFDLFLSLFT